MADPSTLNELREFLNQLMTVVDHNVRQQAEAKFDATRKANPDSLVLGLLGIISDQASSPQHLREFSCVLLRRLIIPQDHASIWIEIDPTETQPKVKSCLLSILAAEANYTVQRKISDIVGVLGMCVLDDDGWPELIPFMFKAVTGDNVMLKERSLSVFAQIGNYIGNNMSAHFGTLRDVFQNCLDPSSPPEVQVQAAMCLYALLDEIPKSSEWEVFTSLIPALLQVANGLIATAAQHQDQVEEYLETLICICETKPRYFRSQIDNVVKAMLNILGAKNLDHRTRRFALEFLVTMAEHNSSMVRSMKDNAFVQWSLPVIAEMTLEMKVVKDEVWCNCLDDDEIDDPDKCEQDSSGIDIGDASDASNSEVALQALDRLAMKLGHKRVLGPVLEIVNKMLQVDQWKMRYAGMLMICHVVESMPKREPDLGQLVQLVSRLAESDPSERVRFSAIFTLSQICEDCSPEAQVRHHAIILPAIELNLGSSTPRLQAAAAVVLVNFCEGFGNDAHYRHGLSAEESGARGMEIVNSRLQPLLVKLFALLQSGPAFVKEYVLSAVSSLARASGDHFNKFYGDCMPVLLKLFQSCGVGKENSCVRSRVIECISLIGGSVGKEIFKPDAATLIQGLLELQQHVGDNSGEMNQILTAWSRLATCLGRDFDPYLEVVLPTVLKAAGKELKYDHYNQDSDFGDFNDDEDKCHASWQNEFYSIRTTDLDEKIDACRILLSFVTDLKQSFAKFVEPATEIFLPLLTMPHSDLRIVAGAAMPNLIACAATAVDPADPRRAQVNTMAKTVIGKLLDAMQGEQQTMSIELDALKTQAQSLKECILATVKTPDSLQAQNNPGSSTAQSPPVEELCPLELSHVNSLCVSIFGFLQSSIQRRAMAVAEATVENEEDDDDAAIELEQSVMEEEELHFFLSELISALLKVKRHTMLPVIEQEILPKILTMTHPNCRASDRRVGCFMADDIIEHVGAPCAPIAEQLFSSLLACATDSKDFALVQAAVYGLGVAGTTMGTTPVFRQMAGQICTALASVIQDPAIAHDEPGVCDNAVASLGKIAAGCPEGVDSKALYEMWLSHLPLMHDLEESSLAMSLLVDELQRNNPFILTDSTDSVSRVAFILTKSIGAELLEPAHVPKVVGALKQLESKLNPAIWGQIMETLSPEEKSLAMDKLQQ